MGNTSFIINDWFITDLKLKGNDLLVFSLIFSFTKDGRTKYYGSIKYLSDVLGCSKRTINYSLESLTNQGLIVKEIQKNANEPNRYCVDLEVVQKLRKGSAKIASEVVQKLHMGSAKIAPNNNIYNNIDNIYTPERFLERWKAAREYYDKKPTNISKLTSFELVDFNQLIKTYTEKDFDKALTGFFSQKTFPQTRLRPSHFLKLEHFETYLTCFTTKEKLYETKNNKKPIDRL